MGCARGSGRPRGVRGTRRGDLERETMKQRSAQARAETTTVANDVRNPYLARTYVAALRTLARQISLRT